MAIIKLVKTMTSTDNMIPAATLSGNEANRILTSGRQLSNLSDIGN